MQVFFVMAGITSVPSTLIFRKYIYQKSKRLLIPYVFYGIVLLLLGAILPTHIELSKGFLGILYGRYSIFPPSIDNNIPLLQACGYLSPFWFIPCIFLSYVLLDWYDHSKRPITIIVLAIVVSCFTPLLPILLPWSIEMAFIGFLLMLCGRAVRSTLLEAPARSDRRFYIHLFIWIACIIVYMIAWKVDGPINMSLSEIGNTTIPFPFRFLFFSLLGISETVFLSICFKTIQESILTRCMAYVGRHALRLLCIHLFIGECVYFLLAEYSLPKFISFGCAVVVIFVVDYILEYFLHYLESAFSKKTTCNIPAENH